MYSFDNLTDYQNLWGFGSFSLKGVLIFPKNFLDVELDTIEKRNIINIRSYRSQSYASLVLSDSDVVFLEKEKDATLRPYLLFFL